MSEKSEKIYVVGLGPGGIDHMTGAALAAMADADIIAGYKTYIDLIADLDVVAGKDLRASGMRRERDRCRECLDLAKAGKTVALVSSGDAGVYGMAGIMLALAEKDPAEIEVEVVPGISAVTAAASILGAPLMHDYAVISLSDLLTDWDVIQKRIRFAGEGDFVIALYNPKSKGRPTNINTCQDILLTVKDPKTPVGIVQNAKRDGEKVCITTLDAMADQEINMFSLVIIGNSKTTVSADGTQMITPRGYQL